MSDNKLVKTLTKAATIIGWIAKKVIKIRLQLIRVLFHELRKVVVTSSLAKYFSFLKMVNKFTKKTLKFGAIFLLHEAAFTLCILEREGRLRQEFYKLYKEAVLESKE